jgi:hypothetical protein
METEIPITMAYAGQLAGVVGASEETAPVPLGTELTSFLRDTALRHGEKFQELLFDENEQLRRALVISIDGKHALDPKALSLTKPCEIFIMTPIAGG